MGDELNDDWSMNNSHDWFMLNNCQPMTVDQSWSMMVVVPNWRWMMIIVAMIIFVAMSEPCVCADFGLEGGWLTATEVLICCKSEQIVFFESIQLSLESWVVGFSWYSPFWSWPRCLLKSWLFFFPGVHSIRASSNSTWATCSPW